MHTKAYGSLHSYGPTTMTLLYQLLKHILPSFLESSRKGLAHSMTRPPSNKLLTQYLGRNEEMARV